MAEMMGLAVLSLQTCSYTRVEKQVSACMHTQICRGTTFITVLSEQCYACFSSIGFYSLVLSPIPMWMVSGDETECKYHRIIQYNQNIAMLDK